MSVIARTNVFVSYSRSDELFLLELLEHLKPFERTGSVSKWSDKDLVPGSDRFSELQTALTTAKVAVLLVSSSFLASDFIHDNELSKLLQEAKTGGVRILWIHVRACSWKETPLKNYQAALSPEFPLAEMHAERDKAWVKICESIGEVLDSNSRSALRRLLSCVLLTSSDFDAFCINNFPDVYHRFAEDVNREGKLNLLLTLGDAVQIRSCLRDAYPDRVALFNQQQGGLRPKEHQRLRAADRLKDLLRKRATLIEYSSDLTRIDAEIDREKKALRQGPRVKKGEILSDCYQLTQKINQGAYGEIWIARDLKSDTDIAIKILHGKWNDREEIVSRFAEVAKQIASISHPHAISVLSPVMEWEEFHYYVMEYLAGGDLYQAVLRDSEGRKKRAFLSSLSQVGEALTCLHGKGLVHRDIKPQNILFDAEGSAKISDFDLLGGDILKRSTETGEARGTFLYAAPEQFGNAAHADARADIHALGRTALFVIYGGDLPMQVGDDRVRFVESLPIAADLKKILLRATEPEPTKRYATVAEFCTEFAAALESLDALSPAAVVAPAEKITDLSADSAPAANRVVATEEIKTILEAASPALVDTASAAAASLHTSLTPDESQSRPFIKQTNQFQLSRKNIIYTAAAIIATLIFATYILIQNTKQKAGVGAIAASLPELKNTVFPAPTHIPDLSAESQTDLAPVPDAASELTPPATSKIDEPKILTVKRDAPKSDLHALEQALPKLKRCLSLSAADGIVAIKVVIKISSHKIETVIMNVEGFKANCMEEILKEIMFPPGASGRILTAYYSFSSTNSNVLLNEQRLPNKTAASEIASILNNLDVSSCAQGSESAEIDVTFASGKGILINPHRTPPSIEGCLNNLLQETTFPEFTGPSITIKQKFHFKKPTP